MKPTLTGITSTKIFLAHHEVVAAWSAQADENNQWDDLGEDEKITFAMLCALCWKGLQP